ncbi:PREDICTED: early nodulin-like protein 2 [Ipomoea nil]|uniref:early nodulin-like protein 2 n=1 Tax=Ipomoea nil TaxID=35883 RepID=UPI000901455D|nr:PREDICTED: early nodulin-like protein 2 [Ipomoea nil]
MAKNIAILSFLLMLLVLFDVTIGTQIYRVGDYFGWNNSTKIDYSKWSASKDFHVGDVLMFQFDPNNDNVFRVSAEDFAGCRAPSPIGLPSDGQEFYALDSPGRWHFICSIPGRCEAGEKLEIVVHPSVSSAPSSQPSSPVPPTTNPPAMAPAPTRSHQSENQPAPPPQNNPSSSSSSPAGSPLNESPSSSGKLSPDQSPSNSPADEKSASVSVPANVWVAVVAVAVSVFSIERRNY